MTTKNRHPLAASSDEEFIRLLYTGILSRDADPGGVRHYLEALRDGRNRGWLMNDIRVSVEGRQRLTDAEQNLSAIAGLLFPVGRTDLTGLIEEKAHACGGVEGVWASLEKTVSESDVDVMEFLGFPLGWLWGIRNGAVEGLIFGDQALPATVSINGMVVGEVVAEYTVPGAGPWCSGSQVSVAHQRCEPPRLRTGPRHRGIQRKGTTSRGAMFLQLAAADATCIRCTAAHSQVWDFRESTFSSLTSSLLAGESLRGRSLSFEFYTVCLLTYVK